MINEYHLNILVMTCFWAALSGAWNIMAGFGGLMSLGHSAFFGIGAYTTAILFSKWHLSPWLGLFVAVILTTAVAALISYPCFRLKGPFFGLVTLAFPVVLEIVAINWPTMTNGSTGIAIPFEPSLANFMFRSRWPYLLAAFLFMTIVYGIARAIYRSRLGLYLVAVRDDEASAEALGIQPVRVKMLATVISAALTGAAGFFYAQYVLFLDPTSLFSVDLSIQIALLSIIGGLGTPEGPVVGAVLLIPLDGLLSTVLGGGLRLLIYGLVLVTVVLVAPEGIVGRLRRLSWR